MCHLKLWPNFIPSRSPWKDLQIGQRRPQLFAFIKGFNSIEARFRIGTAEWAGDCGPVIAGLRWLPF